ncbi:unnamed protein product [Callosobruchus maculatus]|uniref:CHK kinase-like domain-containing protein n=1 Tax=Callosobruchus maculatus TaxID=64391 RepID=A0A653DDN0_CALMS|nr:unnamed protein product [Callosobruchus maculatus]
MLLFDDVSTSGYHSKDFNMPASYKWLATSVKMLAKLHAASIIVEEKLSKKLGRTVRIDAEYPNAMIENLFKGTVTQSMPRSLCGFILSEANQFQSSLSQDSLKEKVEAICAKIHEHMKSDKIRNVLNHGDLWGANIMYKEDHDTGAASAYFIDFQMIRYAPPSLDLMFLIFVNADRSTRQEHQADMIQLYHKELTEILTSYKIGICKAFSLDELVASCEEVKPIIVCMSLMYSRFLLMSKEQRQKVINPSRASDKKEQITSNAEGPLISRIRGLMEDLLHICEEMT